MSRNPPPKQDQRNTCAVCGRPTGAFFRMVANAEGKLARAHHHCAAQLQAQIVATKPETPDAS